MPKSEDLTFLYNQDGSLHAVMLSPDLWAQVQDEIMQHVSSPPEATEQAICEPMEDWECLLSYWDFQYPPTAEVCCEECGARSEDWTKDSPRKFTLRAANLGGLVRFRCNACNANITKRHFKDHIACECRPSEDGC